MSECYFEIYIGEKATPKDIFDISTGLHDMYDNIQWELQEGYFRVMECNDGSGDERTEHSEVSE